MADNRFSSLNVLKAVASVGAIALGGFLIKNDQKCMYVVDNKNTFIGTGMIIYGTSQILHTLGVIDKDLHTRMDVAGITLTSIVPGVMLISDYFRFKRRANFRANLGDNTGISVWYHPVQVVGGGVFQGNAGPTAGVNIVPNEEQQEEQSEDLVDYPNIG